MDRSLIPMVVLLAGSGSLLAAQQPVPVFTWPMLERLCAYVNDPANGVWIAPVGTVATYVRARPGR